MTAARLRVLLTGRVEWVDPEDGSVEVEYLGWRDRWSIFGVHSYNWRWVRRFGGRDCGCTVNPVTRRTVLVRIQCPDHGKPHLAWDDDPVIKYLDDVPPWARHLYEADQ